MNSHQHPPEEDKEWLDYRARFSDVYDDSNYSRGLQALAMRASHRLAERGFGPDHQFCNVLEIGAGTGEHVPFIRHKFDHYVLSDLDAKALDAAKRKLEGKAPGHLAFQVQAGERLSYPDDHFDRLVATHVLEHIYQPHLALKEWARVIKNGGTLSIVIPTDPGLAWRLGRHLGPRRNAYAQGIPYDYIMAREHVNSCNTLIALIRHYFSERREYWWPLALPSTELNLFFAANITIKKKN